MAFPWLAVAQGAAQIGSQIWQNYSNRKAANTEWDRNQMAAEQGYQRQMELLKYQLDYNTPANQMQRFKDAGLNPNLVYGQGSPGNMQSAPEPPRAQAHRAQVDAVTPNLFLGKQLELLQSQIDLTGNKADESGIKQDLMKAQTNLVNANPFMRPEYVDNVVNIMDAAWRMKKQETEWSTGLKTFQIGDKSYRDVPAGVAKMETELRLLESRFKLSEADQKVKAQIISQKEFQNALLEVQKKFMADGDIGPEQIRQFIMMLLAKFAF